MKVVKPTTVTDAMFVSSTVAENDYAAWNAATNYSIGTRVIRTTTHRIYEALQSGVDATLPENATSGTTPRWLDLGATNRWAMFDTIVNSSTTGTTPIVVVLEPGIINACALVGLENVTSIRVQLHDGATSVYDQTQTLDGTIITDWYEYFFEPYDTGTEALFAEIPPYATGELTVTINSAATSTPGVGGLIVGNSYYIGETLISPTAGIIDYSRKETDTFGRTTLIQRAYSKRTSVKLLLENNMLRRVHTLLADLRSTPCVWVASEKQPVTYAPLSVFGFYRDFTMDIAYPNYSYCNLEIEGLI